MKKLLPFLSFLFFSTFSFAQSIQLLYEDSQSFRGLSVVNNEVLWVSGSQGTVGRSMDSGNTWKWMKVAGFEKTDFRDIEAFDENTAVIMGISEPAYILHTSDGGDSWQITYQNNTPGIFLDAMEFKDDMHGIVIGDPINHKFFMARTSDGGRSWEAVSENYRPVADSGEACFASSGTNIRKFGESEMVFITGGLSSRAFIQNKKISLPLIQGTQSTGANSIAVKNKETMIVVGGDFTKKEDKTKNCVITKDGGLTWQFPATEPNGYRSCVEYLFDNTWITCGLNGVDISNDEGNHWKAISTESFHVVRKAKNGTAVYFAGNNGKIGKLVYD